MGVYEEAQMLSGQLFGFSGRNKDLVREQLNALNDGQSSEVSVNLSSYNGDFELGNLAFDRSSERVSLDAFVQSLAQDAGNHDATFLGTYDFGDMLIGNVSTFSHLSVISDGTSAEVFMYSESLTGEDRFNEVPGSAVQEGAQAPITTIEGRLVSRQIAEHPRLENEAE